MLITLAKTSNQCPARLFLVSQAGLDFDDRAATDFFESEAINRFNKNVFNSLNVGISLPSSHEDCQH
jgi:hypothetical protein